MHRPLLLNAGGPAPLTIGNQSVGAGSVVSGTNRFVVDATYPATATGTLVAVTLSAASSKTVTLCTGTLSGSTYTVRNSTSVAVGLGLQTITISLGVVAGDYLGLWASGSCPAEYVASTGSNYYLTSLAAAPSGSISLGGVSGNLLQLGASG